MANSVTGKLIRSFAIMYSSSIQDCIDRRALWASCFLCIEGRKSFVILSLCVVIFEKGFCMGVILLCIMTD